MTALRALWDEIMTPSARDESPYATAVIFIGHAMLGASLSSLGFVAVVGGAVGLAAVYFVIKERADLGRGGGLADSLVDTAGVALGAFYGPAWWPIVVMALAGALALARGRG